ncbi:hypothetical protein AKJ62_04555 [candidate division MSBL1 archaeon SCGC-AAA259D14]|uniref:Uncharacterized protein n=1 Tax=candidate division MSBL1 archaeon SCGC-AAA259D14 TaxID=1698261 RepID=A0A133U3I8_9EURY|nr:hypothetical protein AKJ62_04555 [candidate division MSBL1 archaeon SCGC-AAA259D14]
MIITGVTKVENDIEVEEIGKIPIATLNKSRLLNVYGRKKHVIGISYHKNIGTQKIQNLALPKKLSQSTPIRNNPLKLSNKKENKKMKKFQIMLFLRF